MAPNPHNLTLSKDAFGHSNEGQDSSNEYPSEVKVVVCGSAGVKAVDSLAEGWKRDGFGESKGKTKLTGIVYELGHGEKADPALEGFSVGYSVPGNILITLIHPLLNGKFAPKDAAPPHVFVNYSLPTIRKAEEIQGENEKKWLGLFKEASQRSLTVELAIGDDENLREAVEKLLGKAWDEEAERAKSEEQDVNTTGVRIIFDILATPPLSTSSSQLLRSKDMENWSDFIRRLALHPRVYLKLSPLPLPNVLPGSLQAPLRSADATGSTLSSTLAGAVHSAADVTLQAVNTAQDATSSQDRKGELLRRLRIFLDPALEAFGDERIVWAAYMGSGSALKTKTAGSLSEAEDWFETSRESLTACGLNQSGLDNVFAHNASKVYRM